MDERLLKVFGEIAKQILDVAEYCDSQGYRFSEFRRCVMNGFVAMLGFVYRDGYEIRLTLARAANDGEHMVVKALATVLGKGERYLLVVEMPKDSASWRWRLYKLVYEKVEG